MKKFNNILLSLFIPFLVITGCKNKTNKNNDIFGVWVMRKLKTLKKGKPIFKNNILNNKKFLIFLKNKQIFMFESLKSVKKFSGIIKDRKTSLPMIGQWKLKNKKFLIIKLSKYRKKFKFSIKFFSKTNREFIEIKRKKME